MWISAGIVRAKLQKYTRTEREWLAGFLSFKDEKSRFSGASNDLFDVVGNTFPAGLVQNVVRGAAEEGFTVEVFDDKGPALPRDLAADLGWLRDYQLDAVNAIDQHERGLIKAPTGCLVGDTVVTTNRAGAGRKMRLDRVVAMVNGAGGGRAWRRDIPTLVRAPMSDGTVRLCHILSAKESGVRPVYRVTLAPYSMMVGRAKKPPPTTTALEATACHRFLTPTGWRRLEELSAGDLVLVDGGLDVTAGALHVQSRLVPVPILSVVYTGEKPTFDLEVEEAEAFIANGIAVHNSGKTEVIIAATLRVPVRWLVLAPRAQLVEQLADRYQKRIPGMPIGRIGEGKWEIPPDAQVVVATFQSLYADLAGGRGRALTLLHGAQALATDEAHTVAADTFWRVAMHAENARIRIGFSGTPLDRGDKRNVLVVAALGPVIYKIPFEELAARGVLARPQITMVEVVHPEMAAPTWQGVYGQAIVKSTARNRAVVEACRRVEKPALCFVREVRHGRDLVKALARVGVRAEFVWGTHSVDYRNTKIRDVVAGRLDVLICSVVFQEGIDVPDLRGIVVASGGKSVIAAIQRIGRGTRTVAGKTTFEVFDIADRGCGCSIATGHQSCRWLAQHALRRDRAYRRESFSVTTAQWASALPAPQKPGPPLQDPGRRATVPAVGQTCSLLTRRWGNRWVHGARKVSMVTVVVSSLSEGSGCVSRRSGCAGAFHLSPDTPPPRFPPLPASSGQRGAL